MSRLRCHISISLDGFVAGPNQSEENPLGEDGEQLHDWLFPLAAWRQSHGKQGGKVNESTRIVQESRKNIGASVIGRKMFGPVGGGAWGEGQWTGWWGEDPPYHHPVFILTHHPRDPVEMEGGTTFHFVTDGIQSALEQAKGAAGGKDVMLWGGGQVAQQYLAAGLLDELELHVVPVVLGDGARLFDNLQDADVQLEHVQSRRGARRHPPQVQEREMKRVATAKPLMLTQVADGVWVRQSEWVWTNSIVVRGEDGLILVDPGIGGSELNQLADNLDRLGIPVVESARESLARRISWASPMPTSP